MKTLKIGRNPDNDIVIDDETRTVSGYHAVMKVYDRTISICDNSTNGTYINGVKATKDVDLSVKKGDEIRLGPHVLLDWSLVAVSSANIDATEIDTDEEASYTIGTESDNRIVTLDPSNHVSRHHAILKLKHNGKYYIYDQSTNGTYVNGVKIKSKVDFPVSITDIISFAQLAQFDWNKVTKVPIPISPPIVHSVNVGQSSTYSTNRNSISWTSVFFIVPILVGIGWYFFNPKKTEATIQTEVVQPQVITNAEPLPTVESTTQSPALISSNSDLTTLYEQNKSAVVVIYTSDGTSSSQGSGFFISSSGVVVSNYHVFKGSTQGLETIKTLNGNYKVESVLAKSEDLDFIIFKVAAQGSTFPYLQIAPSLPKVGENVFAIGAPESLELTLSTGIVSALRSNNRLIQTTTEITHGSSGGPLFNMNGQVIGITSAGLDEANLNFAVSIVGLGFENY